MSTHTHIQYESTASVGNDKLDVSDPTLKEASNSVPFHLILFGYEDVKLDSTPTNWTLFGYAPGTNKLQVVGSGSGGLEEFAEELNSGTPGYGFVRLEVESSYGGADITWAPDGVPATRKGILHTHSDVVAKFFKGYSVQINARTEDDLDETAILKKIKR